MTSFGKGFYAIIWYTSKLLLYIRLKLKKTILFFFLFFTAFLNANTIDVSTSNEIPIYKSIQVATNIKDINEAITNPKEFKEIKYFRRYLQKTKNNTSFWLKQGLVNSSNTPLEKELLFKWDFADIEFFLVKDRTIIFQGNLKEYNSFQLSNTFVIDKKQSAVLYLHAKLNNSSDNFLYMYIMSPKHSFNLIQEKEIFHNGIFLGLLIAMMMYNFFMYFSMKIKSYLYLGFYQFAIICYVSDIRYISTILLENLNGFVDFLFKIILTVLIPILSIVFTKEFLNTKEKMPTINKLLNLFIIIYIVLQNYTVNTILPIDYASFMYILFIIAGTISFYRGNKFAIYYILGFTPTALFNIGLNLVRILNLDVDIIYHDHIQIITVAEAFALSMALYLKLKQTVDEKEKAQKEAIENEKMLLEQSKFATMGEMLASISHQWKQPLNHISTIFANLQMADETKSLTTQYLNKKTEEANSQIRYMSTTIEDFNSFLSSKKELEEFTLNEVCQEALILSNSRIKKLNVKINLQTISLNKHYTYKNGITQILLIVLNNALDALMLNNIENRTIDIIIKEYSISINDNAGGIADKVLPKIFDPYFSTKDKKFGTGLGLYTAKIIMDNIIKGKIILENVNDGARFTIVVPKN